MLLSRVRTTNYRSINDSGEFEIDPGKTLLVGVNEAGKTALLRALQQINAPEDTEKFSPLRDYPRARYVTDIQRGALSPSQVAVTVATFTLTEPERQLILEVAPEATDVSEYRVYRYLDNHRSWDFGSAKLWSKFGEIQADLKRFRAYLAKQEDSDAVVAELDALTKSWTSGTVIRGEEAKKLSAWLDSAFPLIEEGNSTEEERYARLEAAVGYADRIIEAGSVVHDRVPLFVYYSTYFTVHPRINLASLAARQASDDIDPGYDFGNLCLLKLLGLTAEELSDLAKGEPDPSHHGGRETAGYQAAHKQYEEKLDQRQHILNSASVDLTRSIREVWGDENVQLRLAADGQYLKVVVVDDLGVEVELDQRSEGFRWLVSFFVVFKAQASGDLKNAILLLDEPGMSLHALKQQEFRKTATRLAEDNQVIYTTHSPFMVGTDELNLVRIVEMTDRTTGTKVHTRLSVDDPRSIYPLQAALGYELAQSLFGQPRNLVCEGVTDMMYIEALNAALTADGAGLKSTIAIVPANSASKVLYYVTLLRSQKLKVAALLDSDQAGDKAAKQDELVQLLTTKQILRTKDYSSGTVAKAEIEDLLRDTLVQVAKGELGWDVTAIASSQPGRPIVDIFTKEITGFSKYKLVRAFVRWISSHAIFDLTSDEQAGVDKLFKAINNALR
ncbi:AAA family ATPase [Nocardia shimofusensis]|uniref:AAA family ATPase n=1 Tax=Nocardia shimofusensis TaxID=228596 RepID=UPI0008377CB6|nr:AAA family ATPase [Nocardia shimofusensis]